MSIDKSEASNVNEMAAGSPEQELLPTSAAENQLAICSQPAALSAAAQAISRPVPRNKSAAACSMALHRYQHYVATLGRELALLLLCHGTSALAAAVRVSYRLAHVLGLQLQHWLSTSHVPKAAAVVLARVLRSMRTLLQQYVAGPLGRLLTQLVWVQVQLSTDDVLDEGTRLSARLNSCISLLFGSIRLRSHSCLQLAAPSRQPTLAPEFSLSSPAASPTKMLSALRAQQQQQQQQQQQLQQQQRQKLLRSASTPTPNSSPRGAKAQPAGVAAAASTSPFRRRTAVVGSPSSSSLNPWGELSQAERASVARALRFSQHPTGQGSADSEVHVLCSSELRTAILAFLQAHSRHNGSEFVLLRNFNASSPPTPTADPSLAATPTADAAAARAAADTGSQHHQQQQQQAQGLLQGPSGDELLGSRAATAAAAAAGAAAAVADGAVGFQLPALGLDTGCQVKPQLQQRAQIYAFAADGSSGGGSGWTPAAVNNLTLNPFEQQEQQCGLLPVVGTLAPLQQQQLQQQLPEPEWGTPRGSLTLAEAWEQVKEQQQQQQQQQMDASVRADDIPCPAVAHSCGSGSGSGLVLATAANLLAAAAEALGDEGVPDSPHKCDTSPQKAATAAARAAAAAASADSSGSYSSSNERTSFVSAADKFRSLAASAASADSGSDLCSKPLRAFPRWQGAASPLSPTRRSGSKAVADTSSSLHQVEQYARLFPPGSRSFEAVSLRSSGGNSPIGTPACHARNTVTFVKKKLPAAPFSLSASLPLSLDGTVMQDSS